MVTYIRGSDCLRKITEIIFIMDGTEDVISRLITSGSHHTERVLPL